MRKAFSCHRFVQALGFVLAVSAAPALADQVDPQDPQDPPEKTESEVPEDPEETPAAEPEEPVDDAAVEPAEEALAEKAADPEEKEVLPSLDDAQPFKWSWKSAYGLISGRETFRSKNGRVSFRLGAVIQLDGTTGTESPTLETTFGKVPTSIDLRRLRLSSHGRIRKMNFMASFDVGVDAGIKDLWFEGREGGLELYGHHLGKFRFGKLREPFSFERQSGSGFTGFMERSLPVQTFTPGRNIGFMVHDVSKNQRVHWAGGLFSLGSSNQDGQTSSLFSITGRCTGLPIYQDDGEKLLHVGASFSSRNPTSDTRYFSRPEARFVNPYADTGNVDASGITLLGVELAGVYDSWWAQSEWIHSRLEAPDAGNPNFNGGYVQVGYVLTGQHRPYRNNGGVFDRYRPEEQDASRAKFVDLQHGQTVEVVGRVSRTDLSDGAVDGGRLTDFSLGLNWAPSWATRIELNYIYAKPEDQGNASILLLRIQYNPW